MGSDRVLPACVPGLRKDREPGKTIVARSGEIFLACELPAVVPQRGARELLLAVRARGARVVIATSAKREELDALLARGDLGPLVDDATTSDDAPSSKPAPDIVEAALEKAGVAAANAVFVGDTRYDVESAHRAGLACVAVLCGGNDPSTLAGADAVVDDPAALTGALDRPPFAWSIAASSAP
jgi:HAD superfamily hydrolase (TIGR01509 family)